MAKATPKATAKPRSKKAVPKVEPVVEKKEVKVEAKVEAPKTEAPQEVKTPTVKVRVLKEYENVYIGGVRYTGKSGTQVDLPKDVANILRQDGSVI